MKKVILLLIILNIISCKKTDQINTNSKEFSGLGKLTLGTDFSKLKDKDYFSLDSNMQMITYDSVYCIAKYEINKEFGIVENLNVGVKNGKIFWVYFKNGTYTQNSNIKDFYEANLILKTKEKDDISSSDDYYSPDNSIKAYIGYGKENYTYSYVNDNILQRVRNTEDSINNAVEIKNAAKRKQEYMKDMQHK
jgi:hypothetical protein